MRLLLVEDDLVIASELERALRKNGHDTDVARDGKTGLALALKHPYAVILLDVMVPALDGFEVCRRLRAAHIATPVIMLTAKDAVPDRVTGLDAGADDYLVKPFAVPELLARLRALTRRDAQVKAKIIQVADLEIDPAHHTASRAGQNLNLTRREFSLLEALARHTGHVLTRETILERVWNNEEALPNTVNFHMSSLRKKLDPPHLPRLVHTVHGIGYTLRPPKTENNQPEIDPGL